MNKTAVVASFAALSFACTTREPPESTYFERVVAPTLTAGCARSSAGSGCHVADERGNAFGNLDVTTFEMIGKRRDLLTTYGPYSQPGLLLKAVPPMMLEVRAWDGTATTITTDIRHTGGPLLDPSASAFNVLRRWIDAGATENNTGVPRARYASLPCRALGASSSRDLHRDPPGTDFAFFRDTVQPMLLERCGDGNCHGSASNDLQLFCGGTPEDVRASYWAAVDYLTPVPEQSELLRRPLPPAKGGTFHEGGAIFDGPSDSGYTLLLDWARQHGPPPPNDLGPGFAFFARRVQPVLVRKGCMQMQCHSASSFHDYRLRGGSSGSFSFTATRKNYELSLAQLALASDDVRTSRLVRKNLYRHEAVAGGPGIVHRGGPLFEDLPGASANPADCDGHGWDMDGGDLDAIPALCILREWHARERRAHPLRPVSAIVYVRRPLPLRGTGFLEFDAYAPGSDLRIATVSASLEVTGDRSVTSACGLDPATADVKRPTVSWDGTKIAFAARASASTPLRIYEMAADGTRCALVDEIGAHDPSGNGLLQHDFDPAYSPALPGGGEALVFASTRGNLEQAPYDYAGPQRTPADPSRPNANLYSWEPDPKAPGKRRIRQLTYLLDTERWPSFMTDGRIVFTVEKRMPGIAQVALRRINLDGGDYHPLYGQRGSIGFREVSQVVHLADKDFAAIFSDRGMPAAGGALGVFSRSIGVDVRSPDAKDYAADPSAADPRSPSARDPAFFLHSLHLPDASATGRVTGATSGLYASPSPLPDGRILVSFGDAPSAASFDGDYDLWVVEAGSGAKTKLLGAEGAADVEAVAVFARPSEPIYRSSADQPNAYAMDESKPLASVLMNDADVIVSLMTQNTPTGRVVDRELRSFEVWEELPPPLDVTTMPTSGPFVAEDEWGKVYVRRRLLGTVPVHEDGSAHYAVTGGLPILLQLPDTKLSAARAIPRTVREHLMFTPGESVHEGFPRDAFDGFCAGCHGSLSGRAVDAALRPDVLSRASDTIAFRTAPTVLDRAPTQRGPTVGR